MERQQYGCAWESQGVVLPAGSLVAMTVFDLDVGSDGTGGTVAEQIIVPEYAFYKTPLLPASGADVSSTIAIDADGHTFTGTAVGSASERPTAPSGTTAVQASRGVQFFFSAVKGYVEGTLAVVPSSASAGWWRHDIARPLPLAPAGLFKRPV